MDELYKEYMVWLEKYGMLNSPQVPSDYTSRAKRAIDHWESSHTKFFLKEYNKITQLPKSGQRTAVDQLLQHIENSLNANPPIVIDTSTQSGRENSLNSITTALNRLREFLYR